MYLSQIFVSGLVWCGLSTLSLRTIQSGISSRLSTMGAAGIHPKVEGFRYDK
jgi:hypothetical protein